MLRSVFILFTLLSLLLGGCASMTVEKALPSWGGKYTRVDGAYDLYCSVDSDLLELTIVKAGVSPDRSAGGLKTAFLAKIESSTSAKEMQLCRNGLCAKECLSDVLRSTEGIIYKSCNDNGLDGVYR
jgi:hypothetical protein